MPDTTVDRLTRELDVWMGTATRYLVLANAGGAVATLSFLGTSMAREATFKLAVLPLACFVAGVMVTGFVILGQLTAAWGAWAGYGLPTGPEPTEWSRVTRFGARIEPRTGTFLAAAFGCFAVGSVLGIAALLFYS